MDAGKGLSNLQASLAAGDVPDLIITNNTFPNNAAQGAAQPLPKEAVEYFAEKYGSAYTDLMYLNGECYGIAVPWGGIGMLKYNRTALENLGIKTPKEYYLEGNWTYETFFNLMNECMIDADGDGKLDYCGISFFNQGKFLCPVTGVDENGHLVSLMNTERVRDYITLFYESWSLNDQAWNHQKGLSGSNPYSLFNLVYSYPYMVNHMLYAATTSAYTVDLEGTEVIEACPVPAWKEGEVASSALNYVYMLIPNGCKDVQQAIDMMDFIMECGLEEMDSLSYTDLYDYEGLTGCTEWTKTYIAERDAKRDELDAATLALPEYDAEWIKTINEHYKNTVFHMEIVANGVTWDPWNDSKNFGAIRSLPPATSIAQCYPVHQAQCDAFNTLYLTGISE